MSTPFLEVEDLETHFPVETGLIFKRRLGEVRAVDGVRLSVKQGEVLGVVGESGCGKSTLGRTIVQLIPPTSGTVILEGRNLNQLHGRELRRAWAGFQMIFQDPYSSLNPRLNVFDTLAEAMRGSQENPTPELRPRVTQLMPKVGLLPHTMNKYPHEFSADNGSVSPSLARAPWSRN